MFRINFQSLSGTTTFYNLKHGYLSSLFPIPTLCPGHAAAAAKLLQSCLTLCDSMDCSLPGFSVHGFLQARTLEWVAISFSNAWKWKVKVKSLSRVRLLATHGLQPTRLLRPWDFPGNSTGVGCHCLLHTLMLIISKAPLSPMSLYERCCSKILYLINFWWSFNMKWKNQNISMHRSITFVKWK